MQRSAVYRVPTSSRCRRRPVDRPPGLGAGAREIQHRLVWVLAHGDLELDRLFQGQTIVLNKIFPDKLSLREEGQALLAHHLSAAVENFIKRGLYLIPAKTIA